MTVVAPGTLVAVGEYLEVAQRRPYIEIVYVSIAEVVTIIEVLSPSNKVGMGRAEAAALLQWYTLGGN